MNDALAPSSSDASSSRGDTNRRGPKRRQMFGLGIFLGLVLGVAGALVVPGLFPTPEPDCTRPDRVEWTTDAQGAVSLDIDQAGDGTDACNVTVVFTEPATANS